MSTIEIKPCGSLDYTVSVKSGTVIGHFSPDVDGFYYWCPDTTNNGSYSESFLRELADHLALLNAPMYDAINDYFANLC